MKKITSWICIVLIGVIVLSCTGCSEQAVKKKAIEEPVNEGVIKVTDLAGREVKIKGEAKRIVDLALVEGVRILVELGVQDRLVGVSDNAHQIIDPNGPFSDLYCIERKVMPQIKNITNVGSPNEPNVQVIMTLKPDVVFIRNNNKDFADTLEKQLNVPVVCIGVQGNLNMDVYNVVGKIVGKEDRAKELIDFTTKKINSITNITKKIPDKEKKCVLILHCRLSGDELNTYGRYDVIELAGGRNVQANEQIQEIFTTTKEQIVAWNPDYILKGTWFMDKERDGWHTLEHIKQEPVFKAIKAVKNDNVYRIRGYMSGATIATEITEVFYIAKLLYPEKLVDLDVEKEGNDVLKMFYGIDGLYSDMSKKLRLYEWK